MKKKNMKKRPAVFLDRDGTLIEEVNYLSRVEDVRLFPFSARAVQLLKENGFLVIVVTNQSGIGRGIYTEAAMQAIHEKIQEEVGGLIDAFYFCPHLPCDGCACRKPAIGMIESAMTEFDIDLENSWMVGDKKTDVETALAAGLRGALVLTGYGCHHQTSVAGLPIFIAEDFGTAIEHLLEDKSRPQ
jgi:D-glycero-D-manno-heptose 1,7-bisphosphate phosphatase